MGAASVDIVHVIATSPWPNAAAALLEGPAADRRGGSFVVVLDDGDGGGAAAALRARADVKLHFRPGRRALACVRLRGLLRRLAPRTLEAWGPAATVAAAAAAPRAEMRATITDLDPPARGIRRAALGRSLKRFERITCGDAAVRAALAALGAPHGCLVIAPPPAPAIGPLPPRAHARRRLGLPLEAPVLLASGPWAPGRPMEPLTWAAAFLQRGLPELRLLAAGDGELAEPVRQTAARSGLGGHCVPIRTAGLHLGADALAAADLFLTVTRRLGPWLPMADAMAAGLPVIAVRQPSSEIALGGGRPGRLCDPPVVSSLASAVLQLLPGAAPGEKTGQTP